MSERCAFYLPDGTFCKRWASKGSRFCHRHKPHNPLGRPETHDAFHPLARLKTIQDIFNIVRETLNAARQSRISPGQAYAVGYLVDLWLRVSQRMDYRLRDAALENQMFAELLQDEHNARQKLAAALPLPVAADSQPPAPTTPAALLSQLPTASRKAASRRAPKGPSPNGSRPQPDSATICPPATSSG